ncbi:MAG TPA: reverse transcriptase domain-containing protein [Candidatus Sulfotelmatobacter sp.]
MTSPLLANIYLHYVFDLWVNVWRQKWAQGDVVVIRYADDTIVGFQYQADADRFLENLRERLAKFGLELHPDKTRRIEFGRFAEENRKRRGEGKPETFDFLGLTHISGRNSLGRFAVRRKTIRKRMQAKLRRIKPELRKRMHDPLAQTGQWLKSIVRGYFNYYAVPGNTVSLSVFRTGCMCSGGIQFAAGLRNAGSPGHECLLWQSAGFLHRKCSILFPIPVSPLVIRDKNRMR